ncbi:response regulator transcription factor [Microvirga sp. STS02]|uniref:LytR/AlgR family response regulator transcription factor n=1 Tax=Hymenobacter negativus TaxID=2795026 RepID=UPI0018DC1952|nr:MULTISPECIES: LytTR family DNA-binding domain-containing protein [Bacteria]MBH8570988.1 response regulator transcription factor [Hymenobacter negativus]MBR7210726.1 response regulator transcription factor [Microvirga sp. STS02]
MTVLLLEDEYPAAERLQRLLLQAAPNAQVLAVLDTVAGALTWLAAHPAPDLILSDIQLADGLSLEIWEQAVVPSPVIFTTAFDAYAIRAFQAHSVAYLLKPVKLAELQAALAKLRQWGELNQLRVRSEELRVASPNAPASTLNSSLLTLNSVERMLDTLRPYKTRFLVRQGEQLLPLPVAEAAWFLSRNETVTLVATDGRRFVLDYTLEQLEGLLDPARFFRLNRQVIAQLPAVRRLHPHFGGKLMVELHPAPAEEILVSREKAPALKAWLDG